MVLKLFEFDFNITHHYTGLKFKLNSYLHKGYWYHGKSREYETVVLFKELIKAGDSVIEVGGHLGYFTTYFSSLVGIEGNVVVFEPGKNNLSYLKNNIGNIRSDVFGKINLIEKGVGNIDGELEFFLDPITGQNNSFVKDFKGFYANRSQSADVNAQIITDKVPIIKLDTFLSSYNLIPDFIKVDVEGFEWEVVQGMVDTIKNHRPNLMIEIQSNSDKILEFFFQNSYRIYNEKREEILDTNGYLKLFTPNIFFINNNYNF